MKVLITPQFNEAMPRLQQDSQQEAVRLFTIVSAMDQAQLASSPLITKLASTEEPIYTLRGNTVRIFFTLDPNGDVLFLDVTEVKDRSIGRPPKRTGEVTLFGRNGDPKAYIALGDDDTIYSFSGEPLAYLDKQNNIYGFNGKHLGWFEDEIVWDHKGKKIGFTTNTCPAFTGFEPFMGFKKFKPFKNFKQFAPFKPFQSLTVSNVDLLDFLRTGEK